MLDSVFIPTCLSSSQLPLVQFLLLFFTICLHLLSPSQLKWTSGLKQLVCEGVTCCFSLCGSCYSRIYTDLVPQAALRVVFRVGLPVNLHAWEKRGEDRETEREETSRLKSFWLFFPLSAAAHCHSGVLTSYHLVGKQKTGQQLSASWLMKQNLIGLKNKSEAAKHWQLSEMM